MLTTTAVPRPLRSEVRRDAVLDHLSSLRDYSLVALLAPSGYGKTTALAQYAREADRPVAWLRLDEEATDVHHVASLLVGALCRASEALDHLLGGTHAPISDALDPRLLAERLNGTGEHVLIVLDHAGRLSEDGGRWMVRLTEHLREGHQVFISGYPSMAMPLARLVASGQAAIVDQHALAFTADEARALTGVTPGEATALVEMCGGWPIAVALQRPDRPSVLGPAQLIAEIVAELPAALRAVLPDLAPCHVWSDEFVRASGLTLRGDWLEQLQRCGLPLTPLGEGVFLPHRQLMKWLRSQLDLDVSRARHRYQAVAAAYQSTGQPLHAIRTLVDAGALREAEALTATWMAGPWSRAEFQSVLSVLLAFPVLQPALRSQCAYALIEVGRTDEAQSMLGSLPDEVGFHRECGLALLSGRLGEYPASLAYLQAARMFVRSAEEEEYLAGLQVFSLVSVGRRGEAERFFEDHLAALPTTSPWADINRLCLHLYVLPLDAQETLTGVTDQLALHLQRNSVPAAVRANVLPELLNACLLTGRAQLPAALQWLQQPGLVTAEEWGAAASALLRAQGDAALFAGDLEGAGTLYGQARQAASETRFDLSWNQTVGRQADLCFLNGQPDEAAGYVRQISRTGHPKDEAMLFYLQGVEALWRRDLGGAGRALTAAAETDICSTYRWRALQLLRAAGERPEVRCPPPPAAPWLQELTARQLAALARAEHGAASTQRAVRPTAVPVDVVTFRRLEVRVNGVLVHFPFAKAAELCAYLIVHGASRREEIVDALWNGSSDARHMDYFRVAVRRLRLALTEADPAVNNPVTYQGGYYALADTYDLRRDFDLVTRAPAQLDLPSLQEAWTAYEGDFLPTLDSDWAHSWRAEYREQLIQASLTFAARAVQPLDQAAAEAFRQVLRIDRLNESAYHGLIQHHLNGGERDVAQHLFQRYARLIQDEYGLAPAAALQQLMH